MIDFKIKNGDSVTDSTGEYTKISGKDAEFQRAVICICSQFGKFIYDRNLGSAREKINPADENAQRRLELVLNEALAEFENVSVNVLEYSDKLRAEITINDEMRIEEILLNG